MVVVFMMKIIFHVLFRKKRELWWRFWTIFGRFFGQFFGRFLDDFLDNFWTILWTWRPENLKFIESKWKWLITYHNGGGLHDETNLSRSFPKETWTLNAILDIFVAGIYSCVKMRTMKTPMLPWRLRTFALEWPHLNSWAYQSSVVNQGLLNSI